MAESLIPIVGKASADRFALGKDQLVMFDEVVHLQEGSDEVAYCGLRLNQSTFVPHLYTHMYHPERKRYAVHRVLTLDEDYPVYEQVAILENIHFCPDCLSAIGLKLLREA